ncbi:MAG: hypothetical protein H0V45_05575 [Actinobacteria bacterium]|nr:hypothetical protein [Actinomycetota bacterium]
MIDPSHQEGEKCGEDPVERVLDRLERVRVGASGWTACCPAHEDGTPSLSISVGDDGRVLIHCHAGCSLEDVLTALGLTAADLFVEQGAEPTPP